MSSFYSAGEQRVVLQQYNYGSHHILCILKILPDSVNYFEMESKHDFNWMTEGRWSKLESGLWKLIATIDNWQRDAPKLKAELLIDHINVSVKAVKDQTLSSALQLLQNKNLTHNDLCLEIELNYMSHVDKTIVNAQTTRQKQSVVELQYKPNEKLSKITNESDNVQPKIRDLEQRQSPKKKRKPPTTTSEKRGRRSISQGGEPKDITKQARIDDLNAIPNKVIKIETHSRSSSSDRKRRPVRSPMRPGRYNEFVMDTVKTSKTKSNTGKEPNKRQHKPNNANKAALEKTSNGLQQLDGAQSNICEIKQLNEMFNIEKPPKVEILLMDDMDEATVLSTFEKYRVDFDCLFKERQDKLKTDSYKTIDHCHIMDIFNPRIRDNMIKKLAMSYSKCGRHGSLVLNGLLPLWIIRIFMDKYKFTMEQAVRQIADQLKYDTYLKAINNVSLASDLKN